MNVQIVDRVALRHDVSQRPYKYKLFASDIDGTLTEHGSEIPAQLVARIREYTDTGGLFTLATGRPYSSAKHIARQLGVHMPGIFLNGAEIRNSLTGELIEQHRLPESFARSFLPWASSRFDEVIVFAGGELLIERLTPRTASLLSRNSFQMVQSWHDQDLSNVQKVMVISRTSPGAAFYNHQAADAQSARWVYSDKDCWDAMPHGVSKGTALRKLVKEYGIDMSQVVTIGDNLNDVEMTKYAGLGVAVRNAHPELKCIARRVASQRCCQGVMETMDYVLASRAQEPFFRPHPIEGVAVAGQ